MLRAEARAGADLKSKRGTSSSVEKATLPGARMESLAAHSAAQTNGSAGTGTPKPQTKVHRAQSEPGQEQRIAVKKAESSGEWSPRPGEENNQRENSTAQGILTGKMNRR
jgi:hypothetical protein